MATSLEAAVEQVFVEILKQSPALAALCPRVRDDDAMLELPCIIVSAVEQGPCKEILYQNNYGVELEVTFEVRSVALSPGVQVPAAPQLSAAQLDEITAAIPPALRSPDLTKVPSLAKLAAMWLDDETGTAREEDEDQRTRRAGYRVEACLR